MTEETMDRPPPLRTDVPPPGTLEARIRRAAGEYAVTPTRFSRVNLGRAMRRAIAAGLRREQVIALSVLPREEAEHVMSSPFA